MPPAAPMALSGETCKNLGWPQIADAGQSHPPSCIHVLPNSPQCALFKHWNHAKQRCEKAGARLCRTDEISRVRSVEMCPLLGGRLIWTSHACVGTLMAEPGKPQFFLGHYAVPASMEAAGHEQCLPEQSQLAAVCCADGRADGRADDSIDERVVSNQMLRTLMRSPPPSQMHTPSSQLANAQTTSAWLSRPYEFFLILAVICGACGCILFGLKRYNVGMRGRVNQAGREKTARPINSGASRCGGGQAKHHKLKEGIATAAESDAIEMNDAGMQR